MPRFSVQTPELPSYQRAQETLDIDPDTVASIGIKYFHNLPPEARRKFDYGYLVPLHREGKPTLYLRALAPPPNSIPDEHFLNTNSCRYIPSYPEPLNERMHWHVKELAHMESAGANIPDHYSVIVKDRALWNEKCGLLTVVEDIKSRPGLEIINDEFEWPETTLRDVGRILLKYLTEPPREHVIFDSAWPAQFTITEQGITYHDLDPYKGDTRDSLMDLEWIGCLITKHHACYGAEELQRDLIRAQRSLK